MPLTELQLGKLLLCLLHASKVWEFFFFLHFFCPFTHSLFKLCMVENKDLEASILQLRNEKVIAEQELKGANDKLAKAVSHSKGYVSSDPPFPHLSTVHIRN